MRILQRTFPKRDETGLLSEKEHILVLLPETDVERKQLDIFFGSDSENFEHKRIVEAYLCVDDMWKSYIRIEGPRLEDVSSVVTLPTGKRQ